MFERRIVAIMNVSLVTVLLLGGCSGSDQGSQAAAPPGPSAVVAGASTTAMPDQPTSATVSTVAHSEREFLVEAAAPLEVGLKVVGVCSLEAVISKNDGAKHPGDAPNSYKVAKGVTYTLVGFATDKDAARVPGKIKLVLSGAKSFILDAETGRDRPDVADYFKLPALGNAGYQVDAAFDDVPAGTYEVVVQETNENAVCPTHQILTVE